MCGITGWIDWQQNLTQQRTVLDRMTAALTHRGPDDSGTWISVHAALGHRRLSVVDPEGGSQPMLRQAGNRRYVIVYNGELYNTSELRSELVSRGHKFRSHSDTEVLLASYIEWGSLCVEKLNGIYAFAVWNDIEQSLFMARDRLGVKPLFYSLYQHGLLFGSELKALLAHPNVKPRVDAEGLAEIFYLGPSRTPGHGVFKNINELKPGHWMLFNRSGIKIKRYWQLKSEPHLDDPKTTALKVRELLADSVKRQLVADVPVCTFLSGGIDSSALTAFADREFKKQNAGPLHTYSIDYVDNDKNFHVSEFQPSSDNDWIELVSENLNTKHHYVYVDTPQLTGALTTAVTARDLPGMADIDSSLYLFCQEIKQNATVALSGECADEIFGGYPWFHNSESLNANTFPWLRYLNQRTELLSPQILEKIDPYEYVNQRYQETINEVPKLAGENKEESRRREMFYLNMMWFMANLLERKDRMSMATGLEVRVPFCDHRLVEYVWNIPWEMKNYGEQEKGILRHALDGILPKPILQRRKSPYPKTHNPNYMAAVSGWLKNILQDGTSPLLPLINVEKVKSLLKPTKDTFNKPWFGQLMTGPQLMAYLCQVDYWLREYQVDITFST